jgi:hypothetical protein
MILVPLPTAAADHQTANARALAAAGAAVHVPQSELTPERLDRVVREVMLRVVTDRRARLPLLRAALLVNDREVYERAAQISRHVSERMAVLLSPHLEWLPHGERERTVDFALRAATSVLQQLLVFGDIEPARFSLSEAELAQRLGDQFLATLTSARPAAVKPARSKSSRPKK